MPSVFDKKNAAKALGVSTETVDRCRKNGALTFRKIGNRIVFTESDLTTFLNACAIPATAVSLNRKKKEMAVATGGVK